MCCTAMDGIVAKKRCCIFRPACLKTVARMRLQQTTEVMHMEMAVQEKGEIRIIRIEGELDSESAPVAEAALNSLMLEGASKLLLNLEQLSFINHAGLQVLLVAAEDLRPSGGEIRICHANATVMEIFEVAGFTTIIQCCVSEEEALAGF